MENKPALTLRPLDRHIVVDPRVCHGKPVFRGTRILISDVLEQVALGMSWDAIIAEWNGKLTNDAIAEVASLAYAGTAAAFR